MRYNRNCTRCVLHEGANTVCMPASPSVMLLPGMIVGEAPGRHEDAQGKPFVGQAGQILNAAIRSAGFKREDLYITNAVKCRPPDNRPPEREEIEACKHYLLREIKAYQIEYLLLLGSVATSVLLGPVSITSVRGQWVAIWVNKRNIYTLPTFHPAYVMRRGLNSEPTLQFRQDVAEFMQTVATSKGNNGP